ncbi:TPA: trypsin-like peptidase domain-containing protein [Citrobacter freundii]|nr:trypsin-like peptidase domain-containing protein [Citrobacter freundii]HDP8958829.1 trypsin-like peptidase domain-containing protein [Citrobacter freundii]
MDVIKGDACKWHGKLATTPSTKMMIDLVSPLVVENKKEDFKIIEKILNANNLRPVSVLEKLVAASRSVCKINIPGKGMATGFMISENTLMTNNHVFSESSEAQGATAIFNYQVDINNHLLQTKIYEIDNSFFFTNEALDFSIVNVKGSPGIEWGFNQLSPQSINVGDDVFIIQHPEGMPKQIGMSDNIIAYIDDNVIQYLTDTMPGSSGSPIYDDMVRLVGIHHSGGWIPEPSTDSTHFRNEGILISAILKVIPHY